MLRPRASGPASGLYYRGAYAALDFASRIYELDDVSYTAGGLTTVSDFTFTGASLRTMFDSTGAMTYGPNNLVTYSQEFDNVAWVKAQSGTGSVPVVTPNTALAPDGTMTADTVVFTLNGGTASGDISQLSQSAPFSVQGIFSFYAMTTDGTSKVFSIVGNGGTLATVTVTGTYQRFSVKDLGPGMAGARLRLRGSASGEGTATSASIHLWGAQVEAVTYRTTPAAYMPTTSAAYYGPRLVYDPVTLASLGILVEEARTNLCLQSQTFATTWGVVRATITSDAATSPDGTSNADKLVEDTATNTHRATQTVTVSNATAYTYSIYVKAAERTWAFFEVTSGATDNYCYLNLSTGALGATIAGTWTVTALPNGWYRASTTFTSAAVSAVLTAYPATGNSSLSYTGDGASGIYLWQAQLEAGTAASSPIPTTTASVTRAADVANLTGLVLSGGFTLASDGNAGVVGTFRVATISDGTTVNRFGNFAANPTALRCLGVVGGSGTTIESGARTSGTAFKQASRFDGVSTIATSGNGAAVVSGSSALTLSVLTQLGIGGIPGVPDSVGTTISRIRIYNRALSDAQLQALTA